MSQSPSLSVVLAQVMIWTFYSSPWCLSCNPENIFGSEKYQQSLFNSIGIYGSKSVEDLKSFEIRSRLHSEIVKTIRADIADNISYPGRNYSTLSQLVNLNSKTLKSKNTRPENVLRLSRRRRSMYGAVKEPHHITKSDAAHLAYNIPPPEILFKHIHKGHSHKADIRNYSLSSLRFTRNATDSLSSGNGNAFSKASSRTGNALSRSFATGSGTSKAEADVKNGGNATAKAKAPENNSSALASSKGGGHALAAAESGSSGNASSTSISQGNGSSKAVAIVLEGHAVATGIHDFTQNDTNSSLVSVQDSSNTTINFDDPFFRPVHKPTTKPNETTAFYENDPISTTESSITQSTTENEVTRKQFQMGSKTLDGDFQNFEKQMTTVKTPTIITSQETKLTLSKTTKSSTTKYDMLQPTTEYGVKPTAVQMSRTLNGEFEISEEPNAHEATKLDTASSKPKLVIIPSTTENDVNRKAFKMGLKLNGDVSEEQTTFEPNELLTFDVLQSTTEQEIIRIPLQMGRAFDGKVGIYDEQETSDQEKGHFRCKYKQNCDKAVCCNHYVLNLMVANISSWLI